MSLVQRDHIILKPRSTFALCWLVRHWSQARVLDLRLDYLPIYHSEDLKGWEDHELASWEAHDVVDRAAGLTCMRALRVSLGKLCNISPLTQMPLKHLQLELRDCVPVGGLNMLGCMALLETLVLHCGSDGFEGHPNDGEYLPELDLGGCSNLRAIAFKMSIPLKVQVVDRPSEGISVPAAAALAGGA
ncbi:g3647 [Coccomyxa elongata]